MSKTLTISLPEDLRQQALDEQVAQGRYPSADEYIHELIRQDQRRAARQRLEADLVARLDDTDSVVMDAADFRRMREEFRRRLAARNGGQ